MDSDIPQQPGLITSKLGSFTENLPEDITPESSVAGIDRLVQHVQDGSARDRHSERNARDGR